MEELVWGDFVGDGDEKLQEQFNVDLVHVEDLLLSLAGLIVDLLSQRVVRVYFLEVQLFCVVYWGEKNLVVQDAVLYGLTLQGLVVLAIAQRAHGVLDHADSVSGIADHLANYLINKHKDHG